MKVTNREPLVEKPPERVVNVQTAGETAELLARLQQILSLWDGSNNKIMGHYIMIGLPIPMGVDITKLAVRGSQGKIFCVNGVPVAVVTDKDKK